jgi:hypothetical protein
MNEASPRPTTVDEPQIGDPSGGPAGVPPFVVVLGMHRSGTSLCADALGHLGVSMAERPDAQPSNPRGQWERPEIVACHDRILEMFERGFYNPLHDLPLPAGWWLEPAVAEIRREIIRFIEQKRDASAPFGFKDPRTARLLPLWHQIFDELRIEPKIVLCLRNPAQVARSLEQRDGLPAGLGEYRWYTYTAEIFRHLRHFATCVIEYEAWFEQGGDNVAKLSRFLGLSPAGSATAAPDLVDPQLRHDDARHREAQAYIVRWLYEHARRYDNSAEARAEIAEMLDRLAAFEQLQESLYRGFEQMSRLAAPLLRRTAGESKRGPVSWSDTAVAAEAGRLLGASDEAEMLRGRLQQVLEQRAELDAALARAQQQAALQDRAAKAAAQELAALRRRLEQREAAPGSAVPKPDPSEQD